MQFGSRSNNAVYSKRRTINYSPKLCTFVRDADEQRRFVGLLRHLAMELFYGGNGTRERRGSAHKCLRVDERQEVEKSAQGNLGRIFGVGGVYIAWIETDVGEAQLLILAHSCAAISLHIDAEVRGGCIRRSSKGGERFQWGIFAMYDGGNIHRLWSMHVARHDSRPTFYSTCRTHQSYTTCRAVREDRDDQTV